MARQLLLYQVRSQFLRKAWIMKFLILLILSTLTAAPVWASSAKCSQLKDELQAMQKAQQQIMLSLVNNHETFASTLEEYSDSAKAAQSSSEKKIVSQDMNKSADAFRSRGIQAKEMSERLNQATADLFNRVEACLKQ